MTLNTSAPRLLLLVHGKVAELAALTHCMWEGMWQPKQRHSDVFHFVHFHYRKSISLLQRRVVGEFWTLEVLNLNV